MPLVQTFREVPGKHSLWQGPSGRVPAGSYSLHQKGEVVVRVTRLMTPRPKVPEERRVVRVVTSPSATITAPEDSLHTVKPISGIPVLPTTLEAVPHVKEEKPTVQTLPKPLQSGTPARRKSSPSASPQAATYSGERTPLTLPNHTTPPAPDVPSTSPKRPEFTPIIIPTDSVTDRPWETSPATSSPAFMVQSTPEYLVGSPMQQGSPLRDPTPSPGAAVLPIPPTPTRLRLPQDAFTSTTPSRILRDTLSPQRRRQGVLDRLWAIDERSSALEVEHLTALRDLAQVESEELQWTRQELVAAQEQCRLLRGQLDQLFGRWPGVAHHHTRHASSSPYGIH